MSELGTLLARAAEASGLTPTDVASHLNIGREDAVDRVEGEAWDMSYQDAIELLDAFGYELRLEAVAADGSILRAPRVRQITLPRLGGGRETGERLALEARIRPGDKVKVDASACQSAPQGFLDEFLSTVLEKCEASILEVFGASDRIKERLTESARVRSVDIALTFPAHGTHREQDGE